MSAKTFTPLSMVDTGNGPGKTPIKQCSAVLDNKLQCWVASSYLVKTLDAKGNPQEYQLCRRHAQIAQAEQDSQPQQQETKTESATKTVATSASSFTPAKQKQEEFVVVKNINSDKPIQMPPGTPIPTEEVKPEPAAKPLLQPKATKPAAF